MDDYTGEILDAPAPVGYSMTQDDDATHMWKDGVWTGTVTFLTLDGIPFKSAEDWCRRAGVSSVPKGDCSCTPGGMSVYRGPMPPPGHLPEKEKMVAIADIPDEELSQVLLTAKREHAEKVRRGEVCL